MNQGRCPVCQRLVETYNYDPPEGGKYYRFVAHLNDKSESCSGSDGPAGGR